MDLLTEDRASPHGNEARIWGPPGCGKTTYVAKQIENAARKYGGESVLVTSFTRAAAIELVGRDLPVPNENVGTLHAHCFHALGCPDIADTYITDWNREHPGYRLSPSVLSVEEIFTETPNTGGGDELYAQQQVLRATLVPRDRWPPRVRNFDAAWVEWKTANALLDFTDLLEVAARDLSVAPRNPQVIFVDEAQDLSRLQLTLLRQWGKKADYLVTAGDDDQTIYTFAGAAPEVLLSYDIPAWFRHVLNQSYRVPRCLHALSSAWIGQVAIREPKEYFPRDEDGDLRLFHRGHYKYPEPIVDDAELQIASGKTVMFLATCSYMLEPLKSVLRKRGLPFHNPYRCKRTDWNPLAAAASHAEDRVRPGAHSLTAAERLLAYLRPHLLAGGLPWTAGDLRAWTAWLKGKGVLVPGASEIINQLRTADFISPDTLARLFARSAFDSVNAALHLDTIHGALDWWIEHLKPARRKTAEYPYRVVQRGGVGGLRDTPRIIIGTGHSVKGGEADLVYLFPDLSPSGARNWEGKRADRDTVVRLGYVMMTRAREGLIVCEPAGPHYMPIASVAARVMRAGHAGVGN